MNSRQQTGRLGELAARHHLERLGWVILGVNVRCSRHEIDIVADDNGTLVFVEVRARRGRMFGAPEESITPGKRRQMLRAAQCYLTANDCWGRSWRIDMVAVELDRNDGVARLNVIRNAIEMGGG